MAKELPYFKFETSEWDNGTIQMCSRETKGLFIDLCSMYWARLGDIKTKLALQKLCNGNANALQELIEEDIIQILDEKIVIYFLDEQLKEFNAVSDKRKKAANKRWEQPTENKAVNANALQVQNKSNAIREEKRKEEKIIDIDSSKLLSLFNSILGKQTRIINTKTKTQIKDRLKEGYTKEDIVNAIRNASKDPHHIDSNYKYLTLEFLTKPDKLDRFVNMGDFKIKTQIL
jgi:uncharacterized phage protein (TIGR02220 family)